MTSRYLDVQITVTPGGDVFQRRFTRFVSELTDLAPLLHEIVDHLHDVFREQFRTEGASTGSVWAPLSESYRRWKVRRYPGRGVLVRTGRLYSSLTRAGGTDAIRKVTARRMEFGTAVPYARFHQTGTRRMPARPIVRLSDANKADLTRMVHRYLVRKAAGRLHA